MDPHDYNERVYLGNNRERALVVQKAARFYHRELYHRELYHTVEARQSRYEGQQCWIEGRALQADTGWKLSTRCSSASEYPGE